MDIALKTLILIIFILIPGFLFRRTYYQGGFSKQFDSKSWSHSIFYSVLFALILNALVIYIFHNYYAKINFLSCKKFYDAINEDEFPEIKYANFILIATYLGALYISTYILAFACYEIVRNFKLDRKFEALRFNNHWHYYFKGEIKDFKEFSLPKGKCSCVNVDILVKRDKDSDNNLYSGLLSSYSICNSTGNLEAIYLTEAKIYDRVTHIYKDLNSTVLIIPYPNILNINLNYNFLDEDQTTIDFIVVWLMLFSIAAAIWDPCNFFTRYTLYSVIFLKLFLIFCIALFYLLIFAILRLIIFDKKLETAIPTATAAEKQTIKLSNDAKKEKIIKFKSEIFSTFLVCLVLSLILSLIIFFTYN